MAGINPQLKPRKLGNAEFMRSNVFVAWSRKIGRRVNLIGPTRYDAWLVVEFDSQAVWFCERPPIDLELLPLEGKRCPLDFWLRKKSGEQVGIVVHDPAATRDKSLTIDLLQRSLAASKLKCEIWQGADLRSRAVYIRNLKQLQPFVAVDERDDEGLATDVVAHLARVGTASWSEMLAVFSSRFEGQVNAEIARLIHAGRITAELTGHALASNTMLSRHEPG